MSKRPNVLRVPGKMTCPKCGASYEIVIQVHQMGLTIRGFLPDHTPTKTTIKAKETPRFVQPRPVA